MELPVVLPPVEEQRGIGVLPRKTDGEYDALTAEAQSAITAAGTPHRLISAAVTGRIDVRSHTS